MIFKITKSLEISMRWAGHVARMEEGMSFFFKILTGKLTGKSGEDNIRMDNKEIGIKTRNWVDSAEDKDYYRALVNATLNLLVPQTT